MTAQEQLDDLRQRALADLAAATDAAASAAWEHGYLGPKGE
ncbi:MAG TPA: hypothetical protein VFU81_20265 [Thermomicrobiales bacterium]|nr:hypothetical protein [Thermomicrobiales bacterium]